MEYEMLQNIVADVLNVALDEVTLDTRFVEDLGADSLDLYQVVVGIEEAFEISFEPEAVNEITTVKEAVNLIKKTKRES